MTRAIVNNDEEKKKEKNKLSYMQHFTSFLYYYLRDVFTE